MTDSVLNGAIGFGDVARKVQHADAYGAGDGATVAPPRRGTAGRIPPRLYRMGEVVQYSGLSRQTIHNYATMGLLRESRWTAGGHRLFDECVFGRLDQIARLKRRRKTMREIREHFARLEPT